MRAQDLITLIENAKKWRGLVDDDYEKVGPWTGRTYDELKIHGWDNQTSHPRNFIHSSHKGHTIFITPSHGIEHYVDGKKVFSTTSAVGAREYIQTFHKENK